VPKKEKEGLYFIRFIDGNNPHQIHLQRPYEKDFKFRKQVVDNLSPTATTHTGKARTTKRQEQPNNNFFC
jgi:hypothetical protein